MSSAYQIKFHPVLEAVALVALVTMAVLTANAFFGVHRLPPTIPTHFNHDGRPDGWGSSLSLWILAIAAVVVYGLMTLVVRFPSAFNYPVRVTAENRERLLNLAFTMIAWLKTEMMLLFAVLQVVIIRSVKAGHGSLSPLLLPAAIVAIWATVGWAVVGMFRAGRRKQYSER